MRSRRRRKRTRRSWQPPDRVPGAIWRGDAVRSPFVPFASRLPRIKEASSHDEQPQPLIGINGCHRASSNRSPSEYTARVGASRPEEPAMGYGLDFLQSKARESAQHARDNMLPDGIAACLARFFTHSTQAKLQPRMRALDLGKWNLSRCKPSPRRPRAGSSARSPDFLSHTDIAFRR